MYHLPLYDTLVKRMQEPRRFIQVLAGPRQTGKTTLVHQVADDTPVPVHYASADEPTLQSRTWIEQQWETGRLLNAETKGKGGAHLINSAAGTGIELFYWRERGREVDFQYCVWGRP